MLFNLFYTSSSDKLTTEEIEILLNKARKKNAANEITGMLLYCDGTFIQLLEGEESKVQETFERIKNDPRHSDIRNIFSSRSEQRYFPDWLMAYKHMSAADLATIERHDNVDIKQYFKTSQPYKIIRLLSRSNWQQ